jgi:hypothetical protein
MKKKILIGSLLAVLMLVSISLVSSAEVNNDVERKESPLYGIRLNRRVINEKISEIIENIRTKFLGGRIFFLPIRWLKNKPRENLYYVSGDDTDCIQCYTADPSVYCKCDYREIYN